jgi:hypothetical protein
VHLDLFGWRQGCGMVGTVGFVERDSSADHFVWA